MKPTVYMMLGLPGSGKTTYSKQLKSMLSIPRLSLDEEYSKLGGDLHSHKWNEQIADKASMLIKSRIKKLIESNESVILDFCPWKKGERSQYRDFVESIGANCHIYYFDTSITELNQRLLTRNGSLDTDIHIVTPDMMAAFIKRFDPPADEQYELVQPQKF